MHVQTPALTGYHQEQDDEPSPTLFAGENELGECASDHTQDEKTEEAHQSRPFADAQCERAGRASEPAPWRCLST